MKVEFSAEVLDQPEAHRHLTAIAWMFADMRHRWVVVDPEPIVRSAWLADERPSRARALREHARGEVRASHSPDLVVLPIGSCAHFDAGAWKVPADIAERVLREPLDIVVENARCDGTFLKLVVLRIGALRLKRQLGEDAVDRLRKSWTNPLGDNDRIAVRHGGGSTTATQVDLHAIAEPAIARRLFVLVDSDRSSPGGPLGETAEHVQETCRRLLREHGESLRLSLKILRKREVENYLPRSALEAYKRRCITAWDQLSDEQKDYHDLKEMFGRDLWTTMTNHQQHCHERALRERAGDQGRELDDLVDELASLMM